MIEQIIHGNREQIVPMIVESQKEKKSESHMFETSFNKAHFVLLPQISSSYNSVLQDLARSLNLECDLKSKMSPKECCFIK